MMGLIKNVISKVRQHFQKQPSVKAPSKPQPKAQSKPQTKTAAPKVASPKAQTMAPAAKKQAVQAGRKLLDKGLKVDPQVTGNQKKANSNTNPYKAKEVTGDIPPPTHTPNAKGKSRGKGRGMDL